MITIVCVGIGFVMTVGLSEEELTTKPFKGWRKTLKGVLRFLGRSLGFCFGFHKIKKNGVRATRMRLYLFFKLIFVGLNGFNGFFRTRGAYFRCCASFIVS